MYSTHKILFNYLGGNHISYFIGMVITGPKGGMYLLDIFNTERLIKVVRNTPVLDTTIDNIMRELANRNNSGCIVNIKSTNEVEQYKSLAKQYRVSKVILRKENEQLFNKIANNFQL